MEWLKMELWSPYAVGIGLGILSWFTFLLSDKSLGCSTAFSRFSGMITLLFSRKAVEESEYYKKTPPVIDWQVMLVIGIVIGAFLSALFSGTLKFETVPALWKFQFGDSVSLRWGMALMGGIFMGFGSRWSNGCTSGHGISGTLQMSISGWLSVVFFFAAGILTAFLLYA
ncbi:MAG: YeeE/YedE family protein [bacterium]|nr:YeeE/YedE family protein [bacterium]